MEIKCPLGQAFWRIVLRCPMSQETRDAIFGLAITVAAFLAMAIAIDIAVDGGIILTKR
jgi:hypothetical protein